MPESAQPDFSAGIWQGRKTPQAAVYDTQNSNVDDDGNLARRGASAYYSEGDVDVPLQRLATPTFAGADTDRVIVWGTKVYAFDGATGFEIYDPGVVLGRPVGVGGVLVWPYAPTTGLTPNASQILIYGGSLAAEGTSVTGGTITVTNGSTAVTKSGGSSWTATISAGMFLKIAGAPYGLVHSVDSSDALTLVYPWGGATASTTSFEFASSILALVGSAIPTGILATDQLSLGTAGQRLLAGVGNRIYECAAGFPFSFDPNAYNELPAASRILAIESLGDTAMVFSTRGVWTIENLALDIIDDVGNPQQPVQQLSGDIILWGENGLAGYSPGVVVPALDDVYLLTLDGGATAITEGIRPRYREYVAAGYQPGTAAIHAGHYFLPVLDGTDVVDVLTCRLDRPTQTPSGQVIRPWTRWEGHAAGPGYAVLHTDPPKLLGLAGERVTDLTATLGGQGEADADGSTIAWQAITNDITLGFGEATDLRVTYELVEVEEGALGKPWLRDPWQQVLVAQLDVLGELVAGAVAQSTSRSYLSSPAFGVPLSCKFTLISRPAADIDSNAYVALGFVDPETASGYEARFRFETAADTVTVERWDNGVKTRILGPTALGGRLLAFDILDFRIAADGTMGGYVNGVEPDNIVDTTYFHAGQLAYAAVGISDVVSVDRSSILLQTIDLPTPLGVPVTVEFSSDADGGAWTELETLGEQGGGYGWSVSDASKYQWARVNKKREKIRFRITLAGAAQSFTLRAISLLSRASGKQ